MVLIPSMEKLYYAPDFFRVHQNLLIFNLMGIKGVMTCALTVQFNFVFCSFLKHAAKIN